MSRIHKIKFTKKVKKVYSDEELEVLREHCRDIRELAIVDVFNSTGMPIEQVKEMLGHSQIDTTLIYAQVSQRNVKISHEKYLC